MAFVLNSKITIGDYTFTGGVNDLVIKKNVSCIVDVATLKLPGLGRVVTTSNNLPQSSVQTAKLFKEGDKVSIELGYNGDLRTEFTGFVRRVCLTTPVTLEMEGYAWQLRGQNILASWKKTTLKEVLTRVIQGTDIVLSNDIPLVNLTSFYIKNENGLKVLEYLKNKMLLTIYFDGNVLYAGIEETRTTTATGVGTLARVRYSIGYNCVTDQRELKQRLGTDNRVRVRLKTAGRDGKHVLYEAGDPDGAIIDRIIPYSNDAEYLKAQAAAYLKRLKYDGYEGRLQTFLQPFCKPGMQADVDDVPYDGARAGSYFIPGTEVRFGVRGAQRLVDVSYRLNA